MRAIGGASKELRKEVANLNRDADNGDGWKEIGDKELISEIYKKRLKLGGKKKKKI